MLKSKILKVLEENRGKSISGQSIANKLGVTRASVHKTIDSIRKDGYSIVAVTNKGYCLSENNDVLSEEGIKIHLDKTHSENRLFVFNSIDSTNTYAKQKAMTEECRHGDVIIANEQTAGRGRMGKDFYSPSGTGIYMSFVLKPNIHMSDAVIFTVTAAVAVCFAIEKVTKTQPKIKWVNDIFMDGKKICGILSEAVSNFENQIVESVIVGIGLNVNTTDFPEDVKNIATSINQKGVLRNLLAGEIINNFMTLTDNIDKNFIIHEYKSRSLVLNKEITYYQDKSERKAFVLDINQDGNLIVKCSDGQVITLKSGEISIGRKTYDK